MGLTRKERFERNTGGVLLAVGALTFCVTPLAAYANPLGLAGTGVLLAIAIIGLYNVHVLPNMKEDHIALVVGYGCLFAAALSGSLVFFYAYQNEAKVAEQCKFLQKAIINGQPVAQSGVTVSPAPDAFTALRCRPLDPSS